MNENITPLPDELKEAAQQDFEDWARSEEMSAEGARWVADPWRPRRYYYCDKDTEYAWSIYKRAIEFAYPTLQARVKELEEALRMYSPYVIGSGPSLDHDALTAAHRNAQAALNKEPTT